MESANVVVLAPSVFPLPWKKWKEDSLGGQLCGQPFLRPQGSHTTAACIQHHNAQAEEYDMFLEKAHTFLPQTPSIEHAEHPTMGSQPHA